MKLWKLFRFFDHGFGTAESNMQNEDLFCCYYEDVHGIFSFFTMNLGLLSPICRMKICFLVL